MPYRLGIDLGTNSLGWCALKLGTDGAPVGVIDGGVRIFSNGREAKTGASLAVDRRNARAMRRRRDRYLRRRAVLLAELTRFGLMPSRESDRKALESLDAYHIRAAALDQAVPVHFLGRALFHLNQRRGFKSNRKADRAADDAELGMVATGNENLDAAMQAAGARTYGEYLARRHALAPGDHAAAARRTRIRRDDGDEEYAFYPARRHLEEEFAALWAAQAPHHPDILTEEARTRLHAVIFYQRPLKSQPVGRCAYTDEPRMAKAHPLFQRLRLVKAVNELTVEEIGETPRALTLEQRDAILRAWRSPTETKRSMTWGALRKAAGLPRSSRFKGEDQRGKGLVGDEVEAELVKHYGPGWRALSPDAQWRIIERLREEEDEGALLAFLQSDIGLDEARARAVARGRLPEGHGRIGPTAAARILAELEAAV
ncbi:MAG: type II CRISPR RNA-guided endonuclease Cas9, partial [Blastomonas sp.]